jgi:hypothetical protein
VTAAQLTGVHVAMHFRHPTRSDPAQTQPSHTCVRTLRTRERGAGGGGGLGGVEGCACCPRAVASGALPLSQAAYGIKERPSSTLAPSFSPPFFLSVIPLPQLKHLQATTTNRYTRTAPRIKQEKKKTNGLSNAPGRPQRREAAGCAAGRARARTRHKEAVAERSPHQLGAREGAFHSRAKVNEKK